MEVKHSPLIYKDFLVLDFQLETIESKQNEAFLMEDIPLEINFEILKKSNENDIFNIALNVVGNNVKEPKPGYKFSIIVNGIFSLSPIDRIDKSKIDQYLSFSALPMVISSVRLFLANLTSYCAFGKYWLPAIDLQDLVKKKATNQINSSR